MDGEHCGRSFLCPFLFLVSLIIGAIVATLFFFGVFPFLIFALPYILAFAIILLIVAIIAFIFCSNSGSCKISRRLVRCLLLGSITTVILSIIGIAAAIGPFSIFAAIIAFLIVTFFVFSILVFIALVNRLLFSSGRRFRE